MTELYPERAFVLRNTTRYNTQDIEAIIEAYVAVLSGGRKREINRRLRHPVIVETYQPSSHTIKAFDITYGQPLCVRLARHSQRGEGYVIGLVPPGEHVYSGQTDLERLGHLGYAPRYVVQQIVSRLSTVTYLNGTPKEQALVAGYPKLYPSVEWNVLSQQHLPLRIEDQREPDSVAYTRSRQYVVLSELWKTQRALSDKVKYLRQDQDRLERYTRLVAQGEIEIKEHEIKKAQFEQTLRDMNVGLAAKS
jgi:hypothetical protein